MSFEVQSTTWFKDAALDGIVNATITEVSAVALILLGSFYGLKLAWEWFRYSVNSINDSSYAGRIFDWNEAIRVAALAIILGLYPVLASSVSSGISYINSTTDKSSTTKQKMEAISNKVYVQNVIVPQVHKLREAKRFLKAAKENGNPSQIKAGEYLVKQEEKKLEAEALNMNGTTQGRAKDAQVADASVWSLLMGGPGDFIAVIFNAFFGLIAMIMKLVISGYARVIFKLVLCLGPLAIAFSVFWKDKFLFWFESLLNIGFVFLTLNILDILISDYFYHAIFTNQAGIGESLAFNLATIGAYLSAFRLTGMFIGRTGAHGIMNKSMAFAGTLAAGAVMAAGGLMGGGGGAAAGAKGGGGGAAASGGSSGGGGSSNLSRASVATINRGTNEAKNEE